VVSEAPLVGRDAELDVVRQLMREVRRGGAATLVIDGEAGIGKTQLVEGATREAFSAGAVVLCGEARAFERNRPFGALVGALDLRTRSDDPRRARIGGLLMGRSGPEGPAVSPLGDARFRVVEEILELLERTCGAGPVVLVLEDLHWADDSTLSAIGAIVHELRHVPLLVLLTLRPAPRSPELDVLLDACAAAGAKSIRLQPLGPDEVDALVQSQLSGRAGSLLGSIVNRAGGNPLLVVELLRSLVAEGWLKRDAESVEATADELPSTLRDLVLRRLRYLPDRTLDLLQIASVLGDAVPIRDLSAVARRDSVEVVADLAEAFRAKLLDDRGEVIGFRHQLVQQAIYEELPAPVRKALHRDAASALAHAGAELPNVAAHLLVGAERGDLDAVRWLRRAAVEVTPGAPSLGVDLTRRALELLPSGHGDVDLLTADLAAALMRAGQVAEAAATAAEVLDRPHRSDVDIALQLTLVDALSLQNRPAELTARAEAALRTPALAPAHQALVLTQAAYGQIFSGDYAGGEATARRALQVGEQGGSAEMTCWSLCALSVAVKTQGRFTEAAGIARRAVDHAFAPPDPSARLRHPHFFLAMTLADTDAFDQARVAYQKAIEDAESLGTGWLLPDMLLQAAGLRYITGDWEDAAVELEAGLQLAAKHGQQINIPQSCAYLSLMASARGDLVGARAALERLGDAPVSGDPVYGSELAAFAAATIAQAEGNDEAALGALVPAWQYDQERGIHYWDRYLAPAMARLAKVAGRADLAAQVADAAEVAAKSSDEVPTVAALGPRCRGIVDDDPEALVHAVELSRAGGRLLDHAATCEDAALVLMSAGQSDQARGLLEEALTAYEEVGAAAWATRVAAPLRALGVRRGVRRAHPTADRGWESLTVSERRVSELVTQGLTNREAARRLHISPHTVNTHLRHVFHKLGVANRTELAAQFDKRDANHANE
jgi:DNA-binding CsgD family transcriptional regulator